MAGPFIDSPPLIQAMNNAGPLKVLRALQPLQNATGGFDDAPPSTVVFDPATVVSATGRDLDQVEEVDRTIEHICVYTSAALFTAGEQRAADRVCWGERMFRVVNVRDMSSTGGVWITTAALEEPKQ
jgi:hypothetical protein